MRTPTRRLVAMAPALLAVGCRAAAAPEPPAPLPGLKQIAPFPLGVCAMTGQLSEPAFVETLTANFSQITPEWEMKMEAILKPDGGYDFSRPDAIVEFAEARGLRVHGHTLVWYAQNAPAFVRIDGSGQAFADAYRNYILTVAGRYRGKVVSWDVVNEAINENGEGERDCIWSKNLGPDYAAMAYRHAWEADPDVPLFLNDYFLDTLPNKRRSFLRMAERILKSGAPLGGLGTQTHVSIHMPPGAIKAAIQDLASLGLPIHLSELDVSTRNAEGVKGRFDLTPTPERLARQARVVEEAADAFMALPAKQRFAFTIWGLRDQDSWLRRPPNAGDVTDKPLLFDEHGAPKPAARALVTAFSQTRT